MTTVRTCWKHAHATQVKAEKHRTSMRRQGLGRSNLRVYRCPNCHAWHVGHESTPKR